MRLTAAVDLPWYWGTGPVTWAGDAGLRSTLGAQLEVLAAGYQAVHSIDASESEDAMLERVDHATRAKRIAAVLATLADAHVVALHAHYGTAKGAFGLSGAAVLTTAGKRYSGDLWAMGRWLRGLTREARRSELAILESQSMALVRAATAAFDAASVAAYVVRSVR